MPREKKGGCTNPLGNPRKKKEVDMEACLERATHLYSRGTSPSRIKKLLYDEFGLPFNRFQEIEKQVIDKIKSEVDVYKQCAEDMAIYRVNQMLEDLVERGDLNMALKCLQELHKIQALYEQRIAVKTTEYKLEL